MVIIILKIEIHSTMLGELLEIQSTEIIDPLLLYFTTTIFYLSNAMAARKIASFVGCQRLSHQKAMIMYLRQQTKR